MSETGNDSLHQINKRSQAEKSEVRWTPEQQQVISLRDRSMLVSAAAGSGKTAVLVQRIISMITDPAHPVDVDELLVVTFTNAAAAEMRERVLRAIEAAAEQDPADAHLQRQISLIHNAQITTIDSFCKSVLQNHFHRINLEPGFRIADEGELKLLREDVCDQVLERFYEEKDPGFLKFADSYAGPKNDSRIREMMLRLYDFSQSYPWPGEWLDACAGQYQADTAEELEEKKWVKDFLTYLQVRLEEMVEQYREVYRLTLDEDGPQHYEGVVRDDLRQLERLLAAVRQNISKETEFGKMTLSSDKSETEKRFDMSEEVIVTGESEAQGGSAEKWSAGTSRLFRWQNALQTIKLKSLPGGGKYRGSEEKRSAAKETRDWMKAQINEFSEKYFASDIQVQLAVMQKTGAMVQTLVDVTKAFSTAFAEEKAKKNILDFSDLEHMALEILVNPETKQPTQTAAEYREQFKEVMIDEYQDSNYVQEALLTAVSGIQEGRENLFMVGDVKQSIYRFRLARPELFMEKYENFFTQESRTQRIDLHRNFRSRSEVIDVVNDIFGRIMGKDLGNIAYDADAALYLGGSFEEYADASCCRPECLLVEEDPVDRDKRVTEARVVAQRIRKLVSKEEIPGKRYRDVVILLRSLSGWSEAFQTVFEQEGIPLLVPSQTGYFSAQEVQVILAMLRVLDNPSQDVPLTTVMRSFIGGFSGEELAKIRVFDEKRPFYACVRELGEKEAISAEKSDVPVHNKKSTEDNITSGIMEYGEKASLILSADRREALDAETLGEQVGKKIYREEVSAETYREQIAANNLTENEKKDVADSALRDKVRNFWALLDSFRQRVPYTPIHTLIQQIYDETGYRDYVTAMPAGEQRRANLDMLLEKAIAYEKTSYHGLFHFIRYIDRLMKYEVDYGEAETVSEQENAVRLMTIHKSKGLEFPVVILAGMGKQFNMQDERDRMIFHPEYGIGLKYFDAENRTKTDTLIRQIFSIEAKKENLGEALRMLYVALPRAKAKLRLTGIKPKKEQTARRGMEKFEKLDFSLRMDAKCYWDWVLPALYSYGDQYPLQTSRLEERQENESNRQRETAGSRDKLEKELRQVDENTYRTLEKKLSWEYPYQENGAFKQKVSVSEIKHRAMEEAREILEESGEQSLFPEEIPAPYLPRFVQALVENIGALKGTAAHRFLECLDFAVVPEHSESAEAAYKECDGEGFGKEYRAENEKSQEWKIMKSWLEDQKEFFVRAGRMRLEEAQLLNLYQIGHFLSTEIAGRMSQAARQGRLTKEQPFVMDLPAGRVWNETDSEESVLVQGIIDVFWEEEDGIVLLDYKTDRVSRPEELVARYREQLLLYAEALNRRFQDKKVKEVLIYSFHLDEVIPVF
ncbi:MAG: UvrD-helicase domain-containing protein [Lachnospiraceae bacterium]|nr:UvrD-helicase domain-containing protein [Lachnospiraceae bacterium]